MFPTSNDLPKGGKKKLRNCEVCGGGYSTGAHYGDYTSTIPVYELNEGGERVFCEAKGLCEFCLAAKHSAICNFCTDRRFHLQYDPRNLRRWNSEQIQQLHLGVKIVDIPYY